MIPIDYPKDLRRLLADAKTLDEALAALRARGLSKIDCIRVVRSLPGYDLIEAKKTVHFSSAWADVRERDERFHEELERAVDENAKEERSNARRS